MSAPPISSPCIKVCVLDEASGHCTGCWRTLAEIAGWSRMSEDERRRVVALLPSRRAGAGRPGAPAGSRP